MTATAVKVEISLGALEAKLLTQRPKDHDSYEPYVLECPLERARRGAQVRLVLEAKPGKELARNSLLLKTVARARDWAERIAAGEITSVKDLIQQFQLSPRCVRSILQCASLSPQMIQAVVEGRERSDFKLWQLAHGCRWSGIGRPCRGRVDQGYAGRSGESRTTLRRSSEPQGPC